MPPSRLEELQEKAQQKLAEQRAMALRLNANLCDPKRGLNEVSRRTRKNLEAAITASKRGGTFDYYAPPPDIAKSVQRRDLQQGLRQLAKKQREIERIGLETSAAIRQEQIARDARPSPLVSTLSHWFRTYGTPKPEPAPGFVSSFKPNRKVYKGYGRYKSFPSQACTLKVARMTK